MSDTLGSLVDKLSIVNVKLFHIQDCVHAAAREGGGLDAETTKKLVDLNRQRTVLMNEIDQMLAQAIDSGIVPLDPRTKLL